MVRIVCCTLALMLSMAVITTAYAGGGAGFVEGTIVEVTIKDFAFQPDKLSIKAGTTVRWVNREKRQYHSVWFEQLGEPEPDYFFPEESYERTFTSPGEFPYRCGPHPKMRGEIHVVE